MTTYQRLERECDGLIQEVARFMFNGKCAFGHGEGVCGHHLIPRAHKAFRHHPLNIVYVSQPYHDCFHRLVTSENLMVWIKLGVHPSTHNETQITIALLLSERRLKHHLNFWNLNRFAKSSMPVWESELRERRTELKALLKGCQ